MKAAMGTIPSKAEVNQGAERLHHMPQLDALRAFAITVESVRGIIGWLLSYTFNLHAAKQGWPEGSVAHLWSLSVEEQFYVLWPWIVLYLPRRWLVPAVITVASVGPLFRWAYIL